MVPRTGGLRLVAGCCGMAVLAALGVSCSGSGNETVKGQVLYKGNPVEGAVVTFHPKGRDDIKTVRPSGLTDKDGNFTLSTGSAPGAPPGDYVVTVNWHKPVESAGGKKAGISTESPPPPPDQFQGKPYAARERSSLTATVKSGTNNLEPFRLD